MHEISTCHRTGAPRLTVLYLSSQTSISRDTHLSRQVTPDQAQLTSLVDLKDVSQLIFQLLNLPARVDLLARGLGVRRDRLLQHGGNVWNGPGGTAEVEGTLLVDIRLDDLGQGLAHAVLDVDLLRLVTGEGPAQEGDDTGGLVGLPFLAVAVLLALVAGAHVQQDGADFLALGLFESAVLDERAERSETGTQTSHDDRLGRLRGQLHHAGLDADGDRSAGLESAEVPRSLTDALAATRVDPVDNDDHQGHRGWGHLLAGGDRVLPALHRAHDAHKIVEAGVGGRELLQDVGEGDGLDLGAVLELRSALLSTQGLKLLLLLLVRGKFGEGLVEALWRATENVDVLHEGLVNSASFQHGWVLARRHLDDVVRIETVELDELHDLFAVVLSVDTQGLADVVLEAGIAQVEFDVEDVAVVSDGGEPPVLLDVDRVRLGAEIGSESGPRAIRFLEDQALGRCLPVAEHRWRLLLALVERHEAVGRDVRRKTGRVGGSLDALPRLGDLDLAQHLVQVLGHTFEACRVAEYLGELLRAHRFLSRQCDAQEGRLQDQWLQCSIAGNRRVHNVQGDASLGEVLTESGRELLLELIILHSGCVDNDLSVVLDGGQHIDVAQQLDVSDVGDIRRSHSIGSVESLGALTDVDANSTPLDEVVVHSASGDIAGRVRSQGLAQDAGSLARGRIVSVPEGVFSHHRRVEELQRGRILGILSSLEDRLVRHALEGGRGVEQRPAVRAGVLDLDASRLGAVSSKDQRSEHVVVQGGVDAFLLHGQLVADLAQDTNSLGRLGQHTEELLLNEGTVHPDVDDTNAGAVLGQGAGDLSRQGRLDGTEGNQNRGSFRVAVVLEETIIRAELAIEGLEQAEHLALGVKMAALSVAQGVADGLISARETGLVEDINDTGGLAAHANAVVDVDGRQERGEQSREESHVLSLVGGGAGNQAQAELLRESQGGNIVRDQAVLAGVVHSRNMGGDGAGDGVQQRQLLQGRAEIRQRRGRGQDALGNMALAQIKVAGEEIAEGDVSGALAGLHGLHLGGIAIGIGLTAGSPLADRTIEVESLRRVREDLVGEGVGDLLDQGLRGDIRGPAEGGEGGSGRSSRHRDGNGRRAPEPERGTAGERGDGEDDVRTRSPTSDGAEKERIDGGREKDERGGGGAHTLFPKTVSRNHAISYR